MGPNFEPSRSDGGGTAPNRVVFDAILQPHRSLGRQGFAVLMTGVAGASLLNGFVFLLLGAWPVFGFCGAEALLFYVLFRLNYRSARMFERVWLDRQVLTVERHDAKGRSRHWTFQPYWLRVSIDDPPRHDSRLVLSSHGRSVVIGSFLSPEERLDFARALRAALAAQQAKA